MRTIKILCCAGLLAATISGCGRKEEVAAKKDYTGGMTLVKELASYQLTPEQKKVVDGLKLALQKVAGSQAANGASRPWAVYWSANLDSH